MPMTRRRRPRRKKTTCDGKERMDTKEAALGKARRVMAESGAFRVEPYHCKFCGGWHIGRRSA